MAFWFQGVGVGVMCPGMFLGWFWLSRRVLIGVAGRWVRPCCNGNGAGVDEFGFSRLCVSGFTMAAGQACRQVYDWEGSSSQGKSMLEALVDMLSLEG